jgi:hypothetical protein
MGVKDLKLYLAHKADIYGALLDAARRPEDGKTPVDLALQTGYVNCQWVCQ